MAKLDIKVGQRFSMLKIIKENPVLKLPSGQRNRNFTCICDCGREKTVRLSHLRHGKIKSCGCLHGEYHDPKYNRLYVTWSAMKWRCRCKTGPTFKNYGAKGITVCDEWRNSFTCFLNWASEKGWEDGLEIDRIESDKGYYPDNCRFVDQVSQSNNINTNIIIDYNGSLMTFRDILRMVNKTKDMNSIYRRIKRGWNAQLAIDTPIKIGNYRRSGKKW